MSLYERINKNDVDIPEAFDLRAGALCDIKENSIDLFDLMITTFKFGYMQGHRVAAMKDYIDADEFVKMVHQDWRVRSDRRRACSCICESLECNVSAGSEIRNEKGRYSQ